MLVIAYSREAERQVLRTAHIFGTIHGILNIQKTNSKVRVGMSSFHLFCTVSPGYMVIE